MAGFIKSLLELTLGSLQAVPPSAPAAPLRPETVSDTLPSPEKRPRACSLALDVLDEELGVEALPEVGGGDDDELPLP